MNPLVAPLIPAYHLSLEEIRSTLEKVPKHFEIPLIVYNDEDVLTYEHLKSLEKEGQIRLVYIPFQVGKAEAVRRGLKFLLRQSDANIIVQLDGRSKQPVESTKDLVDTLICSNNHMVIGNRYKLQNMEGQFHRTSSSILLSTLVERMTGHKIHDTACGMRAYVRYLAEKFCNLKSFGYGLEIEEILISHSHGLKIGELPIHSNKQDDKTNAEKIEDNFHVLISYSRDKNIKDDAISLLSHILLQVKKRVSFGFNLSVFKSDKTFVFEYIRGEELIIEGYTNQKIIDAYRIYLIKE
jgi:hypothetical protein